MAALAIFSLDFAPGPLVAGLRCAFPGAAACTRVTAVAACAFDAVRGTADFRLPTLGVLPLPLCLPASGAVFSLAELSRLCGSLSFEPSPLPRWQHTVQKQPDGSLMLTVYNAYDEKI